MQFNSFGDVYDDDDDEDVNDDNHVINDQWQVTDERIIEENTKVVLYGEEDCDSKYIITVRAGMKAVVVFERMNKNEQG